MSSGKLDVDALSSRVLKYRGAKRREVLIGAQIGEDSAALDLGGEFMVLSSDPITGASSGLGKLAIAVSTNDVVSNGAEPVAVLLTLLMPEYAGEEDVEKIMADAHQAAQELDVEIIGGHTEFTDAVIRPVVSATAIGKAGKLIRAGNVEYGNDLVLTKAAGLEGTAILFADYARVLEPYFSECERAVALSFSDKISVCREAKIALAHQATAMHDVTEGGVLGAVYEMAAAAGRGAKIFLERIPVHPVTAKLCMITGIDPYKLISSGALLITAANGDVLVEALHEQGIDAAVIGSITNDGLIAVAADGTAAEIAKPGSDELWKAITYLKAPGK